MKHYKGNYNTTNNNQNGIMDIVPGGRLNSIQDAYDTILHTLQNTSAIIAIHSNIILPSHFFIPAISTLGFKNPKSN